MIKTSNLMVSLYIIKNLIKEYINFNLHHVRSKLWNIITLCLLILKYVFSISKSNLNNNNVYIYCDYVHSLKNYM